MNQTKGYMNQTSFIHLTLHPTVDPRGKYMFTGMQSVANRLDIAIVKPVGQSIVLCTRDLYCLIGTKSGLLFAIDMNAVTGCSKTSLRMPLQHAKT
jgi:hypothetical protein